MRLNSTEHEAFKAEQLRLNKAASRRFALWQNRIGRPVPRSATDRRPDPGTLDNDDGLIDG